MRRALRLCARSKKWQERRIRGRPPGPGRAPLPQFRLAITRQASHMRGTARPVGARTLRSDGKDYRADYEHDDLSPNNLKPPNAPRANGPLCETYERERNPNGSCQWHSEILQSFARLRLYLAGGRRQRRVRPCVRARALRRSGAERGRQGLLRDRGRQARARQASRERATRLSQSPLALILTRQPKPPGFFCAPAEGPGEVRSPVCDQASCR